MRRARLAAEARIGEHVGLFLQTELATGDVFGIDAYAFYELERLQLRLGRFVGAQPRAFNPTSSVRIDAVDRAVIAERWGQGTIGGDGRDFGFEARYEDEQGTLAFFLHNGDGNWSRLRGNYRGGLSSLPVTEGIDRTGLAFSISGHREVQTVDGLEIGGFVGYNGSRNPNTEIAGTGRGYGTASVHAYWGVHPGSQPFRLKADLIAIRYEEIEALNIFERSVAFALLGAARAREATEIFARYEYESRLDVPAPDHFFTLGAHLSTSALRGAAFHHERLTLGYGVIPAADNGPSQHLVVLQAQIVF